METATKAPQVGRPAEKVMEALATLAGLLDRTINEVKNLDKDFQTRLMQAVHDTESSLQAQTAEHVERARQEVQEQLNTKFQGELQSAIDGLKSEFDVERERLNKELLHAVEAASQLEAERSGLIAEVQRVKENSAAEIEKAQEEARAAAAKAPAPAAVAAAPPASLQEEMARYEARLQDILKIIDDPATELSKVIRLNVEKSEVEAYLKGMRFAINGAK
jgi:uncharacterized phage infection (PIP) family protein YhgE